MSRLVFWSSRTQNTFRFVEKVMPDAIRIPMSIAESHPNMEHPFVLIVPTFGSELHTAIPKPVSHFLQQYGNADLLTAVIGAGNRSFGDTFCLAAKLVSKQFDVPFLYRFEMAGTDQDVLAVKNGLERFWRR